MPTARVIRDLYLSGSSAPSRPRTRTTDALVSPAGCVAKMARSVPSSDGWRSYAERLSKAEGEAKERRRSRA
eukprot:3168440-Pleurochrysis_carterae.AAC.2